MPNLYPVTAGVASIAEMTTEKFLRFLEERQIGLTISAGRLRISAPAGALDASLEVQLKSRKAELLQALMAEEAAAEASSKLVPLSAEARRGRIPLTPTQQGIWLIEHFNPGSAAYNIPEAFGFDGRLEQQTMQAAVDRLMKRQSILRTSFHEEDGELFQTIAAETVARVEFTDLCSLPEEQREAHCRSVIRDEGRQPFDLRVAPPIRFHLFRLADQRHIICFHIHHIVADRTSLYLLRHELIAQIEAVRSGRDAALPLPEFEFADYSAWLTKRLPGRQIAGQIAYWKKKLTGLPETLELPRKSQMPQQEGSHGATRRVVVTPEAQSALAALGTQEGTSPFMTYLAVFAVALARWSQSSRRMTGTTDLRPADLGPADFCIGSPMTHRSDAATREMLGLFLNMLAIRCVIAPGMSFRTVLRQVRGTALEAYENSDVPFQTLVREINPNRRSRRSPIFQVMFGYEPYLAPMADDFLVDAAAGAARYDLSLHMLQSADGSMTALFEYCTRVFGAEAIEGLIAEGDAAMYGITLDPDKDVFGTAVWTERAEVRKMPSADVAEGRTSVTVKRDMLSKAVRLLSSAGIGQFRDHRKDPVGAED